MDDTSGTEGARIRRCCISQSQCPKESRLVLGMIYQDLEEAQFELFSIPGSDESLEGGSVLVNTSWAKGVRARNVPTP